VHVVLRDDGMVNFCGELARSCGFTGAMTGAGVVEMIAWAHLGAEVEDACAPPRNNWSGSKERVALHGFTLSRSQKLYFSEPPQLCG
jgi:hypothetical protein